MVMNPRHAVSDTVLLQIAHADLLQSTDHRTAGMHGSLLGSAYFALLKVEAAFMRREALQFIGPGGGLDRYRRRHAGGGSQRTLWHTLVPVSVGSM